MLCTDTVRFPLFHARRHPLRSAKKHAMKLYMERRLCARAERSSVGPGAALRQLNGALFPGQRRFFCDAAVHAGKADAEAEANDAFEDEYEDEYPTNGGGLGFGAANVSEAAFAAKLWPAGIEPPKRSGARTPGSLPLRAKKEGRYDPIVHG